MLNFVPLLLRHNTEIHAVFCSCILPDKDAVLKAALETATTIAVKSPVAVQATKLSLVYSRDHSVPDSLEHVVSTCLYHLVI